MKFGAHSYIFTDRWSDDTLSVLDEAKELGLDIIDIAVGDDVTFDAAKTGRRAQELGLELAISPGGLWPLECDLSAEDAGQRQGGLAWHKQQVDRAAAMGAVAYSGSLYGHTGVVRPQAPCLDVYLRIAEGLHQLADYAQSRQVTIVIEPMSHFRTNLVNKPEQAVRLVELAAHANLGVLLDTYHMVAEVRDYYAGIRAAGKRLWGLHACENDRGVPGGGIVPWDDVFRAVAEMKFDGYLIMEAYNSSIPGFAYQRGMFHNVCPDAGEFVRQGLAFLRAGLNLSSH